MPREVAAHRHEPIQIDGPPPSDAARDTPSPTATPATPVVGRPDFDASATLRPAAERDPGSATLAPSFLGDTIGPGPLRDADQSALAGPAQIAPTASVPVNQLSTALPVHIRQQLAELQQQDADGVSVRRSQTEGTEIELSPVELGRLKMVLQQGERGLQVTITVERPETLDLVRRHLDTLQRSLTSDGINISGVHVGAEGAGHSAARDQTAEGRHGTSAAANSIDEPTGPTPSRTDANRLDMRL
ncbi:flagellar hook-length control protein FliK [Jannaschia sp. M317]|uniref:flagellar hook-length control protein FliK n=1 Tax=Jannaschia sp. M317 TaxID=2867011 RepID=UPI0021A36DB5|nr:flagellar hook-length control protein FliK [Jannaschia sp. M317]UWQ17734.1 flagellar hook-length control protein FliK [Jannaschia sp. M317]